MGCSVLAMRKPAALAFGTKGAVVTTSKWDAYTQQMTSRRRPVQPLQRTHQFCSVFAVTVLLGACTSSSPPTPASVAVASVSTSGAPASVSPAESTVSGSTTLPVSSTVSGSTTLPESGTLSGATTSLTPTSSALLSATTEPVFEDSVPSAAVALPTTAACVAPTNSVAKDGEVTFVSGAKVWAVTFDGTARCLYDLKDKSISQLAWSPDSLAVLLGPDQVARGAKITASGYLPTNADVEWSGPKGTSLLAATAKGGLVKRNSKTAARTDISYLDQHQRSAYHPAGTGIASIGTGQNTNGDTTVGIWISNNLGQNSKLIIEDGSNAKLSEIAFSGTGDQLYFIAEHDKKDFHLHQYLFGDGAGDLSVAFDSPGATLSNLVTSTGDDGSVVAVRNGECDAPSATDVSYRIGFDGGFNSLRSKFPSFAGRSLTPIGWLPGDRLAVLVRSKGCSGSGDLHVVNPQNASDTLVATSIEVSGVRSPHAIPNDLVIDIGDAVEA
jgi:hypothetical protein